MRYTDITGTVWFDEGGTINQLSGARVNLLDEAGNQLLTTVTGEDGLYALQRLLPGTYEITVSMPAGHVVVEPDDARITEKGLISIMKEVNRTEGTTGKFVLRMGDAMQEQNIGGVLPGILGDFLWLDLNKNGLQDTDEGGIPGVTIDLERENGELIASTVTDQYGYYRFTDLYPSSYILVPHLPEEVTPTQHREDVPGIVSVLEDDGRSIPVPVISDSKNYDADMGCILVHAGDYPAGYGQGATQDWRKD